MSAAKLEQRLEEALERIDDLEKQLASLKYDLEQHDVEIAHLLGAKDDFGGRLDQLEADDEEESS